MIQGVFESKQSGILNKPTTVSDNFVGGMNGNEYRARYAAEIGELAAGLSDDEWDSDFEN